MEEGRDKRFLRVLPSKLWILFTQRKSISLSAAMVIQWVWDYFAKPASPRRQWFWFSLFLDRSRIALAWVKNVPSTRRWVSRSWQSSKKDSLFVLVIDIMMMSSKSSFAERKLSRYCCGQRWMRGRGKPSIHRGGLGKIVITLGTKKEETAGGWHAHFTSSKPFNLRQIVW